MNRKPTRAVLGARIAVGFRYCGPVARAIVSDAWLFARLNASNIRRSRTRGPKFNCFSARTSKTQMLSSRFAFDGSMYAVPLALNAEPAGTEIVAVRAKLTPDW